MKYNPPHPPNYYQFFFLSNRSFGGVKEKPNGEVYFTYPKHMLL